MKKEITKEDIFVAYIAEYVDYDERTGLLIEASEPELRILMIVDGKVLDVANGTQYYLLGQEDGYVIPPVYQNIPYFMELIQPGEVTQEALTIANKTYKNWRKKKEEEEQEAEQRKQYEKSKKLVSFPKERQYTRLY